MINNPAHLPAVPFFMKAENGERFCLYHSPNLHKECLGAFIYIHPFAEEMNKSRRMIALQCRAMADLGYAVLQLDLFGCGDSSGDFADARWEIWIADLATAEKWLSDRITAPISLWGLRLGALLALDFARRFSSKIHRVILWQPIISTELFLTQFLRLRLANEIFSDSKKKNSGTQLLRNELASGKIIEIAGYEISPALVSSIDAINIANLAVTQCPVHWFEIVPESRHSLTPAGESLANTWIQKGSDLSVHLVPCVPFWSTQEISVCSDLLTAMTRLFSQRHP